MVGFFFQREARGVGSYLGGGSISDGGGMLTVMAKLMKQELASDAEEEGLVPALSGRSTSMRKVPSLSDLSDPESSLGEFFANVSPLARLLTGLLRPAGNHPRSTFFVNFQSVSTVNPP